jgi:hypothetical protein
MDNVDIFEDALAKLRSEGIKIWMHPVIQPYAEKIFYMMITHYEEREEYENCSFLKTTWEKYQKCLTISKIIGNLR